MRMYDIIEKKRNGGELTDEEIRFFINGFTDTSIPDYQASALMMAIYFKGMTERETVTLTEAMEHSGDTVDLSRFGTLSADKHSTGGVGDKTSLIVTPIVASLGAKVAKMSGRGLGHTGGTVDKLESIDGYKTTLTGDEFLNQVDEIGLALIGQSGNLTPADKKLYALRDVTATVDSIPLITSSIMSKKLAAGSHNIVLDVKCGSGAFMKTPEDAEALATEMVKIGKACGRNIAAVITDMDTPLGTNIGNSLEVIEAVKVLKGEIDNDLKQVSVVLASELVSLVFGIDTVEAERRVNDAIDSGAAFEKMNQWIAAQGGNTALLDDFSLFKQPKFRFDIISPADGFIHSMNTEKIGIASVVLGAGRENKGDAIDFSAGIVLKKKTGDYVKTGDVLVTLYSDREESFEAACKMYLDALVFDAQAPSPKPIVYKVVR